MANAAQTKAKKVTKKSIVTRKMSKAGKEAIAKAQRKRWAAYRKENKS